VELIVTAGTAATLAAMSATNTIPIVFGSAGDPVGAGLVASLGRPGGNVTGFSIVSTEMTAKRLAVLRELLPAVQRVGILETSNPYFRATRKEREQACRSLSIQPIFVEVATSGDVANAVAEVARRGGQGLLVEPEALFQDNLIELMRAVLRHALPMATSRAFIREIGALVSYDNLESEEDDRGAAFVDRILRGAKPADLPVEQPTKFELKINLKTAKTLGIAVPPSLLSRAHEVIE
jgi:putative ABC transport system substrate-binding protein